MQDFHQKVSKCFPGVAPPDTLGGRRPPIPHPPTSQPMHSNPQYFRCSAANAVSRGVDSGYTGMDMSTQLFRPGDALGPCVTLENAGKKWHHTPCYDIDNKKIRKSGNAPLQIAVAIEPLKFCLVML